MRVARVGRYTSIGQLIGDDPDAARRQLDELLAKHGSVAAMARALDVDYRTASRWLERLGMRGPRAHGARRSGRNRANGRAASSARPKRS